MKKFLLLAIACALGATACSRLREPTDAQLGNLLRSERADPADADAALDGLAIECLRGWSEDKELLKDLPMRSAGEEGRKTCRAKLDVWIADTTRNPDKFSFADLSAPKTVHRAMDLQAARTAAALTKASNPQTPQALTRPTTAAVPSYTAPTSNVDIGVASMPMQQAESLCEQAAKAAAAENPSPRVVSYAKFCATTLRKMRVSMEQFAKAGNAQGLQSLAQSADNMANNARDALATQKAQ